MATIPLSRAFTLRASLLVGDTKMGGWAGRKSTCQLPTLFAMHQMKQSRMFNSMGCGARAELAWQVAALTVVARGSQPPTQKWQRPIVQPLPGDPRNTHG